MGYRRWAAGGTHHESGLYSSGVGSTTGGGWGLAGLKTLAHEVESSVKAYIPEDEVEACRGWRTDYIVDTCEVISAEETASKVMGVEPDSKLSWQFEEEMTKVVGCT